MRFFLDPADTIWAIIFGTKKKHILFQHILYGGKVSDHFVYNFWVNNHEIKRVSLAERKSLLPAQNMTHRSSLPIVTFGEFEPFAPPLPDLDL